MLLLIVQNPEIDIQRSKTAAGWRTPTLNDVCKKALASLYAKAQLLGAADPEHFVFPWHGREQKIDASRPMTSWRSAWRSILYKAARNDEGEVIYAGLLRVRFHDARHTAVTTLRKGFARLGDISSSWSRSTADDEDLLTCAKTCSRSGECRTRTHFTITETRG